MTSDMTGTPRWFFHALRAHKWRWVIPTVLVTGVTAAASSQLAVRYRSEATIAVEAPKIQGYAQEPRTPFAQRLPAIRNQILSRTKLERVIQDLDLYQRERASGIMERVVEGMRGDIGLTVHKGATSTEETIQVSFVSTDPQAAARVANRLSTFIIDESTRDRRMLIEGTDAFLETLLAQTRQRIIDVEAELEEARRQSGGRVSRADELQFEALQDLYKSLLTRKEESNIRANLERREIGESFRLLDQARVPEEPIGPSRMLVTLIGALTGLGFGTALVAVATTRRSRRPGVPAVS